MTAPTIPANHVVALSRSGSKTHLMDRRYAPLGFAVCGSRVQNGNYPSSQTIENVACKKCMEATR